MDTYQIVPFEGVADLRFGLPRSTVQALLGGNFRTFREGADESVAVDSYDETGFHLVYDADDRLEFIEMFFPAMPMYDGVSLLEGDLEDVLTQLSNQGYRYRLGPEGYNFPDLGLVLYAPDESIEGVSVYRRGYYEDHLGK